jgi:hypothetical protein
MQLLKVQGTILKMQINQLLRDEISKKEFNEQKNHYTKLINKSYKEPSP